MQLKTLKKLPSLAPVTDQKKRVLVVDDHSMIREGVARTVEADPGLVMCGEASSVEEAIAFLERAEADVILLDLSLQASDGVFFIKQLRARWPTLPILVYSMHNEETYAERVLKAGAAGYLMKDTPPQQLVASLKDVLDGEIALSKRMYTRLCRTAVPVGEAGDRDAIAAKLSDRELHVFQLIGTGLTTRAIAERLGLSKKTVDAHREHIKDKLGLDGAAMLTRAATDWVNRALNGC
jgi:DNA-binding NarL/FixJ family response regulator